MNWMIWESATLLLHKTNRYYFGKYKNIVIFAEKKVGVPTEICKQLNPKIMAKELTDSIFDEALAVDRLVVIDFWAEWCGPCKKVSPIIDELATEYEGVVDIFKCDVEDNSDVCEKFGIRNIPTLIFWKNGEVIEKHVGTATKSQLAEKIDANK